jgi:hypothetical protein
MNNNCPECGKESVMTCRCFMADSTCENGHQWHTCVKHGIKVKGHGDHSGNSGKCTCGIGEGKEDKDGVTARRF